MVNERGEQQPYCRHQYNSRCTTDNRPAPKPHFAALQQAPPKLAAAVLPVASGSSSGSGRTSLAPVSRPSSSTGSRVPRPSVGGFGGANRLSQLLQPPAPSQPKTYMLTDKEIDERVCAA